MMLLLLALMACAPTDAELLSTVDDAACQWVDRCSDRYAGVESCVAQHTSEVEPGCVIDVQAYGECVELLDQASCPAGDLFVPPQQCDELWMCGEAQ